MIQTTHEEIYTKKKHYIILSPGPAPTPLEFLVVLTKSQT